jgi:hypothetical protein
MDSNWRLSNLNEGRQKHEDRIDTKSAIFLLADILIGMTAAYVVHAIQEVVQDDVITFWSSRSRRRGLVALLWTGVAEWQMSSFMTKGFKLLGWVVIDPITLLGYLLYNLLLNKETQLGFVETGSEK